MFIHELQSHEEEEVGRPNYGHLRYCEDICCNLNKIAHLILKIFGLQQKNITIIRN